jgi:hypothetical protein
VTGFHQYCPSRGVDLSKYTRSITKFAMVAENDPFYGVVYLGPKAIYWCTEIQRKSTGPKSLIFCKVNKVK